MKYFSAIEEGQAIVLSNGSYRQVPIFERGGRVYAKYGAGLVRLNKGGSTSSKNVRWSELDAPNGVISENGHEVRYVANEAPVLEAAE